MRSSGAAAPLVVLLALPLGVAGGARALAQPAPASETCVDVRIGDARSYDCLNRQLERAIPQRRFSAGTDSPGATVPPTEANTFNQAATQERLGNAFGHSVLPQRPPPTVYSSPLTGR